ncbi:MAG: DUF4058 family protein [Fimbriiglobus sp.]
MPLRDHFRSPVNDRFSWDEVHGGWPMEIVRTLKPILPEGFRAGPNIHLGSPFEVDISTYAELRNGVDPRETYDSDVGTATATLSPTLTVETELTEPDEYEIRVYDIERQRQLVAAIEIVSPSNKDSPEARQRFLQKVTSLMQQDVCVSIVDIVTIRRANLYAELLASLGRSDPSLSAVPPHIYSVTMRLRERPKGGPLLDAWFYPMTLGDRLPTIPIWLRPDLHILLPLETGYESACDVLGIE